MISHSGFFTRSLSGWGSRSASHFVFSASLISLSVRWRMKTGLPRHLMMTCAESAGAPIYRASDDAYVLALGDGSEVDLNLGLGQDVGGRGHVDEEVCPARISHSSSTIKSRTQFIP
jgi:hypothetical protein